ncbi:MAG: DNA repair protein RecN [Lentisphaeria bacterium]|nr:DNA repair protein RecN [Lentisphaeria bacterium]
MLESLFIRNMVLVTELQLDFGPGFLTVTGETGAGKSLILGALQLLAGARAPASLIRRGAKSCEVAGAFLITTAFPAVEKAIDAKLDEYGLPPREDSRLLLRRTLTERGSRAFINGSPVTAAILKEFGDILIDIHGPNDSHSLLAPSRQLRLLDLYGNHQQALQKVADAWRALAQIRDALDELKQDGLAPEELALLTHQLKEIDDAALAPDEEHELLAKHRLVANAARIQTLSGTLSQGISQGENSLVDMLVPWIRSAEELAQLDPSGGEEFLNRLNAISNDLSDLGSELEDYASGMEFDGEALQQMDERIELIQKLKRRYGGSLEEVIATGERIRARLKKAASRSADLETLSEREIAANKALLDACGELTRLRKASAEKLAPAITQKLQHLGFQKALFQVGLTAAAPSSNGTDAVEFLFAPNQGEAIAPLRLAASSGEVARVMLAIKTVLSEVDDIPVLVFDEIDANIGGRTAAAVAAELHSVGARHQVFSITHLPLIAAAGDRQYLVEKRLEEDRTLTQMTLLSPEARILEITRMLGADENDSAALAHARELLANSTAQLSSQK